MAEVRTLTVDKRSNSGQQKAGRDSMIRNTRGTTPASDLTTHTAVPGQRRADRARSSQLLERRRGLGVRVIDDDGQADLVVDDPDGHLW
jgi:hypothetical protein